MHSVMIHEMGHLLGFSSTVDSIDVNLNNPGTVFAFVLDIFRFEEVFLIFDTRDFDFIGSSRNLVPGPSLPSSFLYLLGLKGVSMTFEMMWYSRNLCPLE